MVNTVNELFKEVDEMTIILLKKKSIFSGLTD